MKAKVLQASPTVAVEPALSDIMRMTQANTYHHACRAIALPGTGLIAFDSSAYNHAEMLVLLESVFGLKDVPLKLKASQQLVFIVPPQLDGKVLLILSTLKTYTNPISYVEEVSRSFRGITRQIDVHWVKNADEDEVRYQVESCKGRDELILALSQCGIKVKLPVPKSMVMGGQA